MGLKNGVEYALYCDSDIIGFCFSHAFSRAGAYWLLVLAVMNCMVTSMVFSYCGDVSYEGESRHAFEKLLG